MVGNRERWKSDQAASFPVVFGDFGCDVVPIRHLTTHKARAVISRGGDSAYEVGGDARRLV